MPSGIGNAHDTVCSSFAWEWSQFTAAVAAVGVVVCAAHAGDCGDPASGSCFRIHQTPGCSDGTCCEAICSLDPFCCSTEWDAVCRQLANDAAVCGAPIPANDGPESPAFIGSGLHIFTTVGATDSSVTSIPDACGGVFGDSIFRDVWFEFRASVTGVARFSTCPEPGSGVYSEFDPIIVLRAPDSLEPLACNDEALGCGGYAVLEFAVVAGDRYLIQVGGHDFEIGYAAMRVTETGKPADSPDNESCAEAATVALPMAGGMIPFDLLRATADDASCGSEPGDVWLHVGPFLASGSARLEACSTDAPVRIEVAVGDCAAPRTCSGDNACGDGAGVDIEVGAGEYALVRIASVSGAEGELEIAFTEAPQCPADLTEDGFVNAADLSQLLLNWGTVVGDINGDGTTSAADLSLLLEAWGTCY